MSKIIGNGYKGYREVCGKESEQLHLHHDHEKN